MTAGHHEIQLVPVEAVPSAHGQLQRDESSRDAPHRGVQARRLVGDGRVVRRRYRQLRPSAPGHRQIMSDGGCARPAPSP